MDNRLLEVINKRKYFYKRDNGLVYECKNVVVSDIFYQDNEAIINVSTNNFDLEDLWLYRVSLWAKDYGKNWALTREELEEKNKHKKVKFLRYEALERAIDCLKEEICVECLGKIEIVKAITTIEDLINERILLQDILEIMEEKELHSVGELVEYIEKLEKNND